MAKNITLLGASYSDVPSVVLPQTGGGTAQFDDTSDANATASDIATGKTAYVNGVKITGTNSGGGGGGGVNNGNDVVFIDYDGTVVASYSKDNLEMPANPSHTGLTAQGWNWSQAEIEAQLTAYPNQPVYVGQMYITDDGDTRLYVHFEEGRTSPYLGLGVNGTVTIDWGDNSATDILTGTSLTKAKTIQHIYQAGDYVIKLTPTSGSFSIFGVSNTSHLLKASISTTANLSKVYTNAVRKIELGTNVSLGIYAFQYCYSLASITIPDSVTAFGNSVFNSCYSLASITIPDSVTAFGNTVFYNCYSLASVAIPNGVTNFGSTVFDNCYSLTSVTIPNGVTNFGGNAFYNCYSLASITIPDSVTSIGTSTFYNCCSLASVTISDSLQSIIDNMFYYCYSLASVTIPNSVTSIGMNSFTSCYSLASVTIPDSVTSIGKNAFSNCYGMAEYHILSTTPPTLGTNAFQNIPTDCTIYVPTESLEAYQTATNWSTYASHMVGE